MRGVAQFVAYCAQYEFEDLIVELTQAQRVSPLQARSLERSRHAYRAMRTVGVPRELAWRLAPKAHAQSVDGTYDLFIALLNNAWEAHALSTVRNWRTRCRRAVCFVAELWWHKRPFDYLLECLQQFDHCFSGIRHPVEPLEARLGTPCSYLPQAADVLRFAPSATNPPAATIDVCNLGRRSAVTHQALLDEARARRLFYYYDTVKATRTGRTFKVDDPAAHRLLLASLLQRSRYFLVSRARADSPAYTQDIHEISTRFYEGAAAGAVMIGQAPDSAQFREQFDWEDAVIPMPFDCPDIAERLRRLNEAPVRLERARRANLAQAARRHDWLYRLTHIFNTVGLAPTAAMRARERELHAVAAAASIGAPAQESAHA